MTAPDVPVPKPGQVWRPTRYADMTTAMEVCAVFNSPISGKPRRVAFRCADPRIPDPALQQDTLAAWREWVQLHAAVLDGAPDRAALARAVIVAARELVAAWHAAGPRSTGPMSTAEPADRLVKAVRAYEAAGGGA